MFEHTFVYNLCMTSPDVLQAATAVAERACVLTNSSWDATDSSEAVAIAEAICFAKAQLDASLLKVIPLLENSPALRDAGWASSKDFLTHLLGGHKGAGGGLVRAAEQLAELPAVQQALDDGVVTLPQARVIAAKVQTLPCLPRFRTAVADRMLGLVTDSCLDASDLGKAFDGVVAELDPDAELRNADKERARAERGAHNARFLSFSEDGHGGVRIKGYGTVEDVESIRATLLPLAAPVTTEPGACGGRRLPPGTPYFDEHGVSTQVPCPDPGCAHDGRDIRDAGARLWDAWVESCDRLRAVGDLPRDHGTTTRVIVTIDHESLQQQVIDAGFAVNATTSSSAQISASVTRRLACDAEVIPTVLGSEGQVLDVGRAKRLVTPALWTALIVRDQHCAFPGCSRMPLACDAHHIQHWADGGKTSLDNMIMLCRHHHTLIHESPWQVLIDNGHPVWIPPPKQTLKDFEGRISYARTPSRAPTEGQPRAA